MRAEIAVIAEELHVTDIAIFGTDPQRLWTTAEAAAAHGLGIWLQPRLIDGNLTDTVDLVTAVARDAAQLQADGAQVTFLVGCELTLLSAGIIDGDSIEARGATLVATIDQLSDYAIRLMEYLEALAEATRREFTGPVSYAAGEREFVEWENFDVIGLDAYRDAENADRYGDTLRRAQTAGMPVVITEFGCCTYEGAETAGGSGSDIIDWATDPPTIAGDYVRSEQTQADYITDLLAL